MRRGPVSTRHPERSEFYFFSDDANMNKINAGPTVHRRGTDPVTIVPTADLRRGSHGGRLFYFASAQTASTFDSGQMKCGNLMPGMRKKKATN